MTPEPLGVVMCLISAGTGLLLGFVAGAVYMFFKIAAQLEKAPHRD